VAVVDLDPHNVVLHVLGDGAVGQYAQAVAAWAQLGVAVHRVDDLLRPWGDGAVRDASVKVDAHHVVQAGQDQPHAAVLACPASKACTASSKLTQRSGCMLDRP
jgi:hypothetical protein